MSNERRKIELKVERLRKRYDADNDMGPGPDVTWADGELLDIIELQGAEIDGLRSSLAALMNYIRTGNGPCE
ncbi:hypothetical protein KAT92_06635 [Candidatus Babeliales bacterium]|nr:hypothetical protein [Candidatus Babeliales bacterium]